MWKIVKDELFLHTLKFRLFTEKEVSQWFQVPIATLRTGRSRRSADPIPYTKVGHAVRYREDLLLKWIERNTFDEVA